jgi:hypothetical protein
MSWFLQYFWNVPEPATETKNICVESNVDEYFHSSVEVGTSQHVSEECQKALSLRQLSDHNSMVENLASSEKSSKRSELFLRCLSCESKEKVPDVSNHNEFPSLSENSSVITVVTKNSVAANIVGENIVGENTVGENTVGESTTDTKKNVVTPPSIIISRSSPIFYPPRLCSKCKKHRYRNSYTMDQWSKREELRFCNDCKKEKLWFNESTLPMSDEKHQKVAKKNN